MPIVDPTGDALSAIPLMVVNWYLIGHQSARNGCVGNHSGRRHRFQSSIRVMFPGLDLVDRRHQADT
jgi:hypothetical protein